MPLLVTVKSLFKNTFRKKVVEYDLDEELRSHVALLIDEKMSAGMKPEEARRAALIEMGGVEQVKAEVRERRIGTTIESVWRDLSYSSRSLARKPGFTALAILTLAVGIGASTAIFSVVNAVLLQSLPYPSSDHLAIVWSEFGKEGRAPASGSELVSLRDRSHLFQEFGGIWVQSGALTEQGEPEQVKLGWVTSNFLSLLSTRPQLGRFFLPEEQGSGASPVAVLSNGLWRRRYSADLQIIGKRVRLSGQSCTVIGVMPADFRLAFPDGSNVPANIDIFVPFLWDLAKDPRDQAYVRVIGRLREGVTFAQAQAEAESIAAQLRAEFTEYSEQSLGLQVVPLQQDVVRGVRPALWALFAGVGFVLLIACANVANLLLSRSSERSKEITVRIALGAARSRIIRQLLTESIFLSCLGSVAALGVGWIGLRWLLASAPAVLSRVGTIGLNFRVLGFALVAAFGSGIISGLIPAVNGTKVNLVAALKEGGRTATLGKQRLRSVLVGGEVALGFLLLIGAGLMMRTLVRLLQVDPGFVSDHVLTFQVSLPSVRYPTPESSVHFVRELQRRLSALPGVQSTGMVSHLPFDDDLPNWYSYYWREGAPREEQYNFMADHRSVLPGFFDSIGATFVAGRNFDATDEVSGRKIVIIDYALAKKVWPNSDAVGQKLNVENGLFARDVAEVVGVIKHIHYESLANQVRPQIYLHYPMAVRANVSFTLRTTIDPALLAPAIRQEVAKLDQDLPVANIRPMTDYILKARRGTAFIASLADVLAGIALLLSCVGIYGVTANSVVQRTSEIGIRMALGARRGSILAMVLRQSMPPVICGSLAGLMLSFGLAPLLSRLLFGVHPVDPGTFAFVSLFLCAVGFVACFLPAYQATRVDPVSTLRYE